MKVKKISEAFALANPQVVAEAVGKITELGEEASWQLTDHIMHMLQTCPYEQDGKVKCSIGLENRYEVPSRKVSASMTLQSFPEGKRLTFHFTKLGIYKPPKILFTRDAC